MHDVELHMRRGSYSRGFFSCLLFGILGFVFAINGATYTKKGARVGFLVHIAFVLFLGIVVLTRNGQLKTL